MKALIGTKLGMTQVIDDDGSVKAVTIVQAGPMTVTAHKTEEKDGYWAVQLGYGNNKESRVSKSVQGQMKKVNILPKVIREFTVTEEQLQNEQEALKIGASFDVSVFEAGNKVVVSGTSKGKGYAGTVKRHNFNTSAKSHGGNGVVRKQGSIGSMYPQKVYKGRKMAGQMGGDKVTTKNLKVAIINAEENLIGIIGAIPGPKRGVVTIRGMA